MAVADATGQMGRQELVQGLSAVVCRCLCHLGGRLLNSADSHLTVVG